MRPTSRRPYWTDDFSTFTMIVVSTEGTSGPYKPYASAAGSATTRWTRRHAVARYCLEACTVRSALTRRCFYLYPFRLVFDDPSAVIPRDVGRRSRSVRYAVDGARLSGEERMFGSGDGHAQWFHWGKKKTFNIFLLVGVRGSKRK